MKTLTEFNPSLLKNASKTKAELIAAGKTPEELPAAFGEALKLEGDRIGFLLNAVELIESRQEDLKRVIVLALAEGEKPPANVQKKGEHFFVAEYYPPIEKKEGKTSPKEGGQKRGKRGKRRGARGRRDDSRRGPPRHANRPSDQVESSAAPRPKIVIQPRATPLITPKT